MEKVSSKSRKFVRKSSWEDAFDSDSSDWSEQEEPVDETGDAKSGPKPVSKNEKQNEPVKEPVNLPPSPYDNLGSVEDNPIVEDSIPHSSFASVIYKSKSPSPQASQALTSTAWTGKAPESDEDDNWDDNEDGNDGFKDKLADPVEVLFQRSSPTKLIPEPVESKESVIDWSQSESLNLDEDDNENPEDFQVASDSDIVTAPTPETIIDRLTPPKVTTPRIFSSSQDLQAPASSGKPHLPSTINLQDSPKAVLDTNSDDDIQVGTEERRILPNASSSAAFTVSQSDEALPTVTSRKSSKTFFSRGFFRSFDGSPGSSLNSTASSKNKSSEPPPTPKTSEVTLKAPLTVPSTKPSSLIGKIKKTLRVGKHSKSRSKLPATPLPAVAIPPPQDTQDDIHLTANLVADSSPGIQDGNEVAIDFDNARKYLESSKIFSDDGSGDGDIYNEPKLSGSTSTRLSATPPQSGGDSRQTSIEHSLNPPDEGESHLNSSTMPPLHYCSKASQNSPNRELVTTLFKDLQCVIDKSFGRNESMEVVCQDLRAELGRALAQLEACDKSRSDLEHQLQVALAENQRLEACLIQECKARANLEQLVRSLQEQLQRQGDTLNAEISSKSVLVTELKRLEEQCKNVQNQCQGLQAERTDLMRHHHRFEQTKSQCSELKTALAECCEQCDLLQKELLAYKRENNDLKLKLETCQYEYAKLLKDMELMEEQFANEKACLESKIRDLVDGLEKLERSKNEACRKMNDILEAHHDEMNILKCEVDKYKALYEEETRLRQELDRRLWECEEERRRNLQRPQVTDPCVPVQMEALQNDVSRFQRMFEDERKAREESERRLKNYEEEKRKALGEHKTTRVEHQVENESLRRMEREADKYRDTYTRDWSSYIKHKGASR